MSPVFLRRLNNLARSSFRLRGNTLAGRLRMRLHSWVDYKTTKYGSRRDAANGDEMSDRETKYETLLFLTSHSDASFARRIQPLELLIVAFQGL